MKKIETICCVTTNGYIELKLEQSLWTILGFTLVELLLVIAIIAVLVSIAIPSYKDHFDRKDNLLAQSDIASIADCINQHSVLNNNTYPDSLASCGGGNDPWGNAYEYINISTTNGNGHLRKDHGNVPINTYFDLYSKGKDGDSSSPLTASHSRDDIVYGRDGKFIGLGKDF